MLATFGELGCRIVLLSRAELKNSSWPKHLVDEIFFVPDFRQRRDLLNAVAYLNQDRAFDLVAPLDEYAVSTAATLRAHLACPGMDEGVTRRVRDKLIMRSVARDNDIPVPPFSGFNNRQEIEKLLNSSAGPWMVKPRSAGGAVRILKLKSRDEVWQTWQELGDKRCYHLIEEFVPSEVYHVDTIVTGGKVVLEVAGHYTLPPFDVWHGGGVFAARTVPADDPVRDRLLAMNRQVLKAVGVTDSVNHTEFLVRGDEIYFLEIAARVPGSNLDLLTTASTGVDLYVESARLYYSVATGTPYEPPLFRYRDAGIVQCLARQKHPDLGELDTLPEVTWRLEQEFHAGISFAASNPERIDEILELTLERFRNEHVAVLPASNTPG